MVNQHIRQHLEEFLEEETIEFNTRDNAIISPVTNEEVKARITNLKKKKAPGASKINAQHTTPTLYSKLPTYTMHVYLQDTFQKPSRKLSWF